MSEEVRYPVYSPRFSKASLLWMKQLPQLKESISATGHEGTTWCNYLSAQKQTPASLLKLFSEFTDRKADLTAGLQWLHHTQAGAFMATLLWHACSYWRGWVSARSWLLLLLLPLPGARMDQVQQPRKEKGEESGETVLLWLGGRVWTHGVCRQWWVSGAGGVHSIQVSFTIIWCEFMGKSDVYTCRLSFNSD